MRFEMNFNEFIKSIGWTCPLSAWFCPKVEYYFGN
jgi:hypothetical protein